MNDSSEQADPAAIFACALSLWNSCQQAAVAQPELNLSECYQGIDQLMRVVMSIGTKFDNWACPNVDFDALEDVWSYLMEDQFGDSCLQFLLPSSLEQFDEDDCLRVALYLRLPVKIRDGLPVPVNIVTENPVSGSPFQSLQIRTLRDRLEEEECVPYTTDDDPFDDAFGAPYFALYGISDVGFPEHIAERSSYSEAIGLAQKIWPTSVWPLVPATVRPA